MRQIGDEHLVLMSPTRFDDAMIRSYLENRTAGRSYTDEQIDLIARFTRGLPLAISLTATLLQQGQPVEEACSELDDGSPSTVISGLARRYLVHAEQQAYAPDDPRASDVSKILGLALAYGDLRSDPDLLAALWNVADPLDAFQDLAHRHDFVLPVSRRLHDDVRNTLRADLLDPYRRSRVREMNQRALDLLSLRLAGRRGRWPTVDEQLDHTEFSTTLLAGLWHTLWADNQTGLDLFIQILPVLEVADPATAGAAAAIVDVFAGTLNADQRRDLDLLTKIRPTFEWLPEELADPARRVTFTMPGLALQPPDLATADLVIGSSADRQAAVMILQAQIHAQDRNDKAAIGNLQKAAALTASTRLRRAIGSQAQAITSQLTESGSTARSVPAAFGLAAAKIAADLLPDSGSAWQAYADALEKAGRLKAALAAYDKAVALDPGNIVAHLGRGITLQTLDRFQEALAAFDQALTLPGNDAAHLGRGIALQALGRPQDALAAYDQALTIMPRRTAAHIGRGAALQDLGRFQEALAAFDQALALDPNSTIYSIAVHGGRGKALLHLGHFQEALAAYDQVLTLNPSNSAAHVDKGIALAEMGNLDDALAELDTGDRLAPSEAGEGRTWAGAILSTDETLPGRATASACPGPRNGLHAVPHRGNGGARTLWAASGGPRRAASTGCLAAIRSRGPNRAPGTIRPVVDPSLPGVDRLRIVIDSVSSGVLSEACTLGHVGSRPARHACRLDGVFAGSQHSLSLVSAPISMCSRCGGHIPRVRAKGPSAAYLL